MNTQSCQIIRISPTELDHVYVEGTANVRNVPWNFSIHFHLWSDGQWYIGQESANDWNRKRALYMSRSDRYSNDGPTDAAHSKISMEMLPFFRSWVMQHQAEIDDAEIKYQKSAKEHRKAQITEHQKAIEQLQQELESNERLSTYSHVTDYRFGMKPQ